MTRVRFPSPAPVFDISQFSHCAVNLQIDASECGIKERPCGSVVEHSLGKGEIAGPIPAMGTSYLSHVDSSVSFLMFFSESRNGKREI